MSPTETDLAQLKERMRGYGKAIDGLCTNVSTIKADQQSGKTSLALFGVSVEALRKSFDKLSVDIQDHIDDTNELKQTVAILTTVVTKMNEKRINWAKVFKFFATAKGLGLIMFMTTLMLGTFNSEAQDFIIRILQIAYPGEKL